MLPSGAAERRPCCTGALEGIEAFADAGANQLVLVMARLKSGSVLPDRPPKGLARLEARRKCCPRLRHRTDTVALPTHPRVKLRKRLWFPLAPTNVILSIGWRRTSL